VIGDPVNEAARLTDLAKTREPHLVASGAIVARADQEAAHWQLGDEVVLRGRAEPTTLAGPARLEDGLERTIQG
jgi:adenylate cyclase